LVRYHTSMPTGDSIHISGIKVLRKVRGACHLSGRAPLADMKNERVNNAKGEFREGLPGVE